MSRVDLKIVLLGHEEVGKTSLMERFINDRFNEKLPYQNTIGTAFASKQLEVNEQKIVLGVWDTAGSERFETMVRIYYRGAGAAIVCYDVTKPHTFSRARFWIRELRSNEENCKVYICATKSDMLTPNLPPDLDLNIVNKYADGIQSKLFVTSSKTGENVVELFDEIARDFISDSKNIQKLDREFITLTDTGKTSSRCCFS